MHGVVSCTQIGQQKPSCSIANGGLVIDLQRDPFKRRTVEAEDLAGQRRDTGVGAEWWKSPRRRGATLVTVVMRLRFQ